MAQAAKRLTADELVAWFDESFGDVLKKLDWRKPLKAIALVLEGHTKANFSDARSPDGIPWKPLVLNRARSMAKINKDKFRKVFAPGTPIPLKAKPLDNYGLLRESFAANHPKNIRNISGTLLEYGTNVEYAALHQYGNVIRPKKAKALTIPLTAEAVNAGRARSFPGGLKLVWPKGKPFGWLVQDKGKVSIMHYMLVPKSTVPARPFLGINDSIIEEIKQILGESATEQLLI